MGEPEGSHILRLYICRDMQGDRLHNRVGTTEEFFFAQLRRVRYGCQDIQLVGAYLFFSWWPAEKRGESGRDGVVTLGVIRGLALHSVQRGRVSGGKECTAHRTSQDGSQKKTNVEVYRERPH